MFDASSQRSERKKWIHQSEICISVVFFVDLSLYDEYSPEEPNQNKLLASLSLFESVINSRWLHRASIVLLLCNVGRFKEKLQSKPLVNSFPDYTGGSDFNRASDYIRWRFMQLNNEHMIFSCYCEPSDDCLDIISWAVKETVVARNLNSLRI